MTRLLELHRTAPLLSRPALIVGLGALKVARSGRIEPVDSSTFRVTASTGGWRSLPWPFGLVEVSDAQLLVRSLGWSWWVADRCVERGHVRSVTIQRRFGTAKFSILVDDSPPISLRTSTSVNQLTDALRRHGYPIA
jgi:hypothetical protein